MNQNQLNREVAQHTGETVELIKQRGFSIVIVPRRRFRPRRGGGQAFAKHAKAVTPVLQPVCKAA